MKKLTNLEEVNYEKRQLELTKDSHQRLEQVFQILADQALQSPSFNQLLTLTTQIKQEIQSANRKLFDTDIPLSESSNWRYALVKRIGLSDLPIAHIFFNFLSDDEIKKIVNFAEEKGLRLNSLLRKNYFQEWQVNFVDGKERLIIRVKGEVDLQFLKVVAGFQKITISLDYLSSNQKAAIASWPFIFSDESESVLEYCELTHVGSNLFIENSEQFLVPKLKKIAEDMVANRLLHFIAPLLSEAKGLDLRSIIHLNLPNLIKAEEIRLQKAVSLDLPKLKSVATIYAEGARFVFLPNLEESSSLDFDQAEVMNLSNLITVKGQLKLSGLPNVHLPNLKVVHGSIFATSAKHFSAPQLHEMGGWIYLNEEIEPTNIELSKEMRNRIRYF